MLENPAETRPAPYRVDAPIRKVQTVEYDGDIPYLFRHDLLPLNASNIQLVKQHENDTTRVTEQIAKGQFRSKNRSLPADGNLYKALVTGGGWRPGLLEEVRDKESIPPGHEGIYTQNEAEIWVPGWYELDKATMSNFVVERQSHAIENMSRASGEYIPKAVGDISFMYEAAGTMKIALRIGEKDAPAFKLLFNMRRPDSKRRTRFREDFAFGVDHKPKPGAKDDFGHTEVRVDVEQGISVFDEYFGAPVDDPAYSLVVFEDSESELGYRQYREEDRDTFIALFDPNYKVEFAATMIGSFSKTDRE